MRKRTKSLSLAMAGVLALVLAMVGGAVILWRLPAAQKDETGSIHAKPLQPSGPSGVTAESRDSKDRADAHILADPTPRYTAAAAFSKRDEAMRKLIADLANQFSKEELAIIEKYSVEHLDEAVIDAENHYHESSSENRDEAERHYHRVLNLVAKLTPPRAQSPSEEDAKVAAAYEEYGRILKKEEARLSKLPPAEAARERSRIKESVLGDALGQ
ncbi:MAG: hypothetical protein V2A73_23170 [Pseudomonadota bacterium]